MHSFNISPHLQIIKHRMPLPRIELIIARHGIGASTNEIVQTTSEIDHYRHETKIDH